MDRQTRKSIKTDKFAQEVGHTFEFLTQHSAETKRYVAIGLAVLVIVGGIFFYLRHQTGVREQALADAMRIDDGSVGANPQPANLNFATEQEKAQARSKAFAELASRYHGTQEGAIGGIYNAAEQADKGKYAEAEKIYKDVMDSAPADYASLARISLAQVYVSEGKTDEAEKLMRYLIAHPTTLVSKEQASIELAELLARPKPAEARKLLEPLRNSRTAVSRAAIDQMGKIPQTN